MLLLVFASLLEPGDEVIVPAPHYPLLRVLLRGVPVAVPCDAASG